MKKRIFLFTVVLLIISTLFIISASAHPGRTDANGGHWNHSTGEYHYHTGEYAGRGSSGSSSYKSSSSFKPPYDPPAKDSSDSSDSDTSWAELIPFIIIVLVFFLGPILNIIGIICDFLLTLSPKRNLNNYENKLNDLSACLDEISAVETQLKKLELNLHIPDEYEIGKDGLPKEKGSAKWGNTFTLYVSPSGSKLHVKSNCCSSTYPVHICKYRNYRNLICKKCGKHYKMPDMSWYKNYLQYQSLHTKHESLKGKPHILHQNTFSIAKKCNSKFIRFLLLFNKKQRQRLSDLNKKNQRLTTSILVK